MVNMSENKATRLCFQRY